MPDFTVELTVDKPKSGQWHCGPNAAWVTVTHVPTQISARAYHRQQFKAKEIAMACVELMVAESGETECAVPELWKNT